MPAADFLLRLPRLTCLLLLLLAVHALGSANGSGSEEALSMAPTTSPPNATHIDNCHQIVGAAINMSCSADSIFQLGTLAMNESSLDAFCSDPSCGKKLTALIAARDQCNDIELSVFFELADMDGWPQFQNICAPTCRPQYIEFANQWYNCQSLDEKAPPDAPPVRVACTGCHKVNESISDVSFVATCGGLVDFIRRMLAERQLSSQNAPFDMNHLIGTCAKYANISMVPPRMVDAPHKPGSPFLLIVIVLGGLGAMGLVVGCFRRWRREDVPAEIDQNRLLSRSSGGRSTTRTGSAPTTEGRASGDILRPADVTILDRLRVDDASVVRTRLLAKGAHGEVYLGKYNGERVAIKCLLPGRTSQHEAQAMVDEIKMLSRLDSPFVVAFYGVCFLRNAPLARLSFLVEFMDRGDLRDLLVLSAADPAALFPWLEKLQCAWSVAQGLVYLHESSVIHRDLKSRNVLLDSVKGTKLTDFGVSRHTSKTLTMTAGVGTYRWMAPELLSENQYTVAADVFSFGMVLSELLTHRIPYSDLMSKNGLPLVDTAIINMVINGAITPTLPDDCPSWARDLTLACIAADANARPSARQVAAILHQQLVLAVP
ncbi:TKL protein kinase [Saprolegnia diclina VS20]|uniref:TKL protein kinase n=1 Tax=Saprolegnia diclina (strain VS20) TaxID=1156394 RepID=T0S808_SAPDV|nr:TKL protein kinase [Saprolegnia diclina VS20]EQC41338.1 TKL protein kinase [Saprolegnia diclina VS20]|eukprot:XP_008605052.1 TKL protein kinase [Saprolegnia diclina VS20]